MSNFPEPPSPFRQLCNYCNNPDGGFWVIPPEGLHIEASTNKESSHQLTNTLEMTITCPNPACGEVNTIYWDKP